MALELLPPSIREKYEIREWKHASAILAADFPNEWKDIIELLLQFKFCKSWITVGGGRKTKVAEAIDSFLFNRGWVEKEFSKSKHRLRQWIA
jgi:hypothetical protein